MNAFQYQALEELNFELEDTAYKKLIRESEGITYYLIYAPGSRTFSVEEESHDSHIFNSIQFYRGTIIFNDITSIINELNDKARLLMGDPEE